MRAHVAEVLERIGNTAGAVRSYQASQKLDEQTGDARAKAIDWLNYGQFLRRQKQPNTLVLACFLKAEDLVRATPGKELTAIARERQAAEERLGNQSARVRSNLAELLGKAALYRTTQNYLPETGLDPSGKNTNQSFCIRMGPQVGVA